MSRDQSAANAPVTRAARERLRDQQRQEAAQLEAVLTAQRRLAAERDKADRVIENAERGVRARQAFVDAAVVALVQTPGVPRVAALLGRPTSELASLVRAERRRETPDDKGPASAVTA
jgi:pantothenate synthetase